MAGFKYRKNIDGSTGAPTILEGIGKNSVVFSEGDLIRVNTSGFIDVVDTGEAITGVVQGVVDAHGIKIDPDTGTLDTYTMASDNQTVAQKRVRYIPALPHYLFYNDADASLTQAMDLKYFDTNDENDVDVASATDSTTAQVQLIERDPDGDADASKGLFRIAESHFNSSVRAA